MASYLVTGGAGFIGSHLAEALLGRGDEVLILDNLSTGFAPRFHEEMVRKLFISSAAALVMDFHVDGFRVDQTTSIHAYNVVHADGNAVVLYGVRDLVVVTRDGLTLVTTVDKASDLKTLIQSLPTALRDQE